MNWEIEFRGVSKSFGDCIANHDVSFGVERGTLHGIVGENGAGKSTIMKVLYGLYQPDSGEIRLRGEPVRLTSPQVAIRHGIGMVHQHFMLVPSLSVWQNVILGEERALILTERKVTKDLNTLQRQFGMRLDLTAKVSHLSVGEQQQVEILKLLYRRADILILDEPTAVLTPQEVSRLFEKLSDLKRAGKTVLLVTHKLKEILSATDRVTVMRGGTVVETQSTTTLTENELARKIIGRLPEALPSARAIPKETRLKVGNLSAHNEGRPSLHTVSFNVRRGEILGIAGVAGNGQEELFEVLTRVRNPDKGSLTLDDSNLLELSVYSARQNGLSVIPPDRLKEGLIPELSVTENFILGHHREPQYRNLGALSPSKMQAHAESLSEEFDIRPRNPELAAGGLSGGNQQKIIVARETSIPVRCLIAAYPTRGVDIGATLFIHRRFLKLRDEGAAILLISTELDEILALCDRILVLFNGRIVGETTREQASESQLGLWMTGSVA